RERERGTVLILTAIMLVVLMGTAALVIDLGALRGDARVDQSVADFAALAGGKGLAKNNPVLACTNAVDYVNTNAHLSPAINAVTVCYGMGGSMCSVGRRGQVTPTETSGDITVSVHYPVPDSEISDAQITGGKRINDGTPCQRIRVIITSHQQSFFANV